MQKVVIATHNPGKLAELKPLLSDLPFNLISLSGGLEIFALGNTPGVHSRRWFGPKTTDEELVSHMITVAKELPDDNRGATFNVVLSLALPNGKVWSVGDKVEGVIAKKPSINKTKGFPYRSFFSCQRSINIILKRNYPLKNKKSIIIELERLQNSKKFFERN